MNPLDTALALQALKAANYSDDSVLYHAVLFLINSQNADGGWGFVPSTSSGQAPGESNVFVTAHVLKILPAYQYYNCSGHGTVERGVAYLLSKQNADGGFGSSPSKVYETALSFDALIAAGANLSAIDPLTDRTPGQGAINYLTSTQQANGSWNDDPYSTALALQALANIRPNLSASSLTLSKPMPQEGEPVTITATVGNTGLDSASNVLVRFFSGDPASGGVQIGSDQIISALTLNSSTQVSITDSFTSSGGKTIFFVVDPDNLISETSETDNKTSTRLWVATGPDLAVFSEDLKPATYVPAPGTAFTLEYRVRNLGESDAGAFDIALYDGDPTAGAQGGQGGQGNALPLQTVHISGLNGAETRTGTIGVTLTGDGAHTLYLVADAGSLIPETSETNNMGTVTVQVGGVQVMADLAVTPADITLTPARPHAGDAVQISAKVRNQGMEPANNFIVELFDGAPETGGSLIHAQAVTLAEGAEEIIPATWTIPPGIHDILVVLDRANGIVETDETNNRASVRMMTDMVDISLSATDLVFGPSRPVAGDAVTLTVTARNAGIRDTGAFNLALYDGDPNANGGQGSALPLQTFQITNIPGDGSVALSYAFFAEPRTYRFYAVADTENAVTEMYEDNNTAVRSLKIKAPGETLGPELVPIKIDLSDTVTDPQTLAVSGNASVTLRNRGDAKITTSFDVLIFEDRDNDGRYTQGVDNLLGAGTNTLSLWPEGANMVAVPLSGTVKFLHSPLYALIDSSDSILEQDETNNLIRSGSECEARPESPIQPVVKWRWNGTNIVPGATPAIAPLMDTNGDGRIDDKDVPAVVFTYNGGSYSAAKALVALRGDTGARIFSITDPDHPVGTLSYPVVGDINGDLLPEIILSRDGSSPQGQGLLAYSHDGQLLWDNHQAVSELNRTTAPWNPPFYSSMVPALADLDADNRPELVMGVTVVNPDGAIRSWASDSKYGSGTGNASFAPHSTVVADLDRDGRQELVAGKTAYNADGTTKWWNKSIPDGNSTVANLDDDPDPEIVLLVSTPGNPSLYLLEHDGSVNWGPVYLKSIEPDAQSNGLGGPPTIADFDGDGEPELGVKGFNKYLIIDRNGRLKTTLSLPYAEGIGGGSSAAAVFDLNGDGRPEVLDNSYGYFRIFDGKTGTLLYKERFGGGAGSGYQNVVMADVDGDGQVEAVVIGYDSLGNKDAMRVYGSDTQHGASPWVGARKIWNQPSYHVTNVNDDGTIPQYESPGWLLNNTYRCQAPQGQAQGVASPYSTPNLTASRMSAVQNGASVDLTVRIGNGGAKEAASGTIITFYDGDPSAGSGQAPIIGTAATTRTLMPGEYQDVILSASNLSEGLHHVYAGVDAGNAISECREDDNQINTDITVVTGLPDLKVGVEDIVLPPAPYTEGSIVPIAVNVRNIGSVSASGVTVRLFNGSPASGGAQISAAQIVQAIDAGGSVPVSLTFDTMGKAGTNILYIVLDQENGVVETNEANNIALFTIDVQEPQLPNLAITPDGIQISPSSAQEGERVTVTATITNRGAATSSGTGAIQVRFSLGDPASGGTLISEKSIYTILGLGQSATVTASLDTTGSAGQQTVFVSVDPVNAVAESREDDNTAFKTLFIQSAGLASSVSLDKTAYQANESVTASINVTNAADSTRLLTVDCYVKDSAGNIIAMVGQGETLNIGANSTITLARTWNTGKTLAGNYRITAEVAEGGIVVSRANAGFAISPDTRLDAKVTVDKMAYNPNETVALTSVVTSQSGNYLFENLTARISIRNTVDGRQVCSETKAINTLMPEATFTFKSYCSAAAAQAGTYVAGLEVLSGRTVLAASSAGFEVLSTSQTGAGLSGAIAAIVDPVYQGREETFSVSVTNSGTDDLTGLTVSVIVVDPETGEMKAEYGRLHTAGRGETITDALAASTANLAPKTHLAILQVRTAGMEQPKTLASAVFEVKPGIEATKRTPDVTNLLVWVNDGCRNTGEGRRTRDERGEEAKSPSRPPLTKGDAEGFGLGSDNAGHDDKDDDDGHQRACVSLDLLEDALSQAATSYHIVHDKKDFQTELRNPLYTDFLILGDRHHLEDHVDGELREQVNAGKGLILSQYHHEHLERELLGLNVRGSLPKGDYSVEITGDDLGLQGSIPASGKLAKVKDADPADVIGSITVAEKHGSIRHPAIVKARYGNGTALFFAFDLGAQSENAVLFPVLLEHSLAYIHTPISNPEGLPYNSGPGLPVPIELEVKSLGAPFDLRITESYPDSLRIAECGLRNAELNSSKDTTCAWITDNPRITDIHLGPGETKTILYYALTPDAEDTYILSTELGYLENGAYTPYQNLNLEITVAKDRASMTGDILSALDSLVVTGRDREKLRDAKRHVLKARERTVLSRHDIDKNVHDLLKAAEALITITSADITEMRLMLDHLLEYWEAEWYYAFPAGDQKED